MSLCLPQGVACAFRRHDYNSVTPAEPHLRNGSLTAHALHGDRNIPRQALSMRPSCPPPNTCDAQLCKEFRVRRPGDLTLPKAYVLPRGSGETFSEAGH